MTLHPNLNRLVKISFELIHLPETVGKHFSFVLHRNNIVSIGWSKLKMCPLAVKYGYKWGTHSEFNAIRNFNGRYSLSRCKLVNVRVNSTGKICVSKPCDKCQKLLDHISFKEVYFTN